MTLIYQAKILLKRKNKLFAFFILKEKEFDTSLSSAEKHCWKHVNLRGGKFEFVNTTVNILFL